MCRLITFFLTSSNVNLHPRGQTHRSNRSALPSTIIVDQIANYKGELKSIAKLLATCHLMVEMKKRPTPHTAPVPSPSPSSSASDDDKSFFSSLSFAIEFLQHLFAGWSTCTLHLLFLPCESNLIILLQNEEPKLVHFCWPLNWTSWWYDQHIIAFSKRTTRPSTMPPCTLN